MEVAHDRAAARERLEQSIVEDAREGGRVSSTKFRDLLGPPLSVHGRSQAGRYDLGGFRQPIGASSPILRPLRELADRDVEARLPG